MEVNSEVTQRNCRTIGLRVRNTDMNSSVIKIIENNQGLQCYVFVSAISKGAGSFGRTPIWPNESFGQMPLGRNDTWLNAVWPNSFWTNFDWPNPIWAKSVSIWLNAKLHYWLVACNRVWFESESSLCCKIIASNQLSTGSELRLRCIRVSSEWYENRTQM